MIFYSTPSSITWGKDENLRVTFHGEWTLEPKFYLDIHKGICWDKTNPPKQLTESEIQESIRLLLEDANAKGWVIEIQRL